MNDRLAKVQPRVVYPVYINKWEPELISIHSTKQGAEAKRDHLRGDECDDDECMHSDDAFVGHPREIES